MKERIIRLFIIILLASVSVSAGEYSFAQSDDAVMIVSKSRGSLDRAQIKLILTGDVTTWPDGSNIQILFNSDIAVMEKICQKYLDINPKKLETIWVKKSVREGTMAPRTVASNVIMTMISNSDKFVGFVKRSEAGEGVMIIE